jgi:hypothetical protein
MRLTGVARSESGARFVDVLGINGQRGSYDALLVSRVDWDVQVVDLPPVSDREAAEALRFRMRALVPGPLEDVTYEYRIQRLEDGRTAAVVAIAPKDTAAAYRAACGGRPLLLPFQLLTTQDLPAPDALVLFWHPEWVELLRYEGGRLSQSTVIARSGDASEDAPRVAALAPSEPSLPTVLCVAATREMADVVSALEEYGVDVASSTVTLQSLAARRSARRVEGLLRRPSRRRPWGGPFLAAALLVVAGALGLSYGYRLVQVEQARADAFAALYAERQQEVQRRAALREDVRDLEAQLQELREGEPLDLYAALSELAVALGSDAVVTSLTVNGRQLQADVVATVPLERAKQLAESGAFQEVQVDRVLPIAGDTRERFSIRGVLRAH